MNDWIMVSGIVIFSFVIMFYRGTRKNREIQKNKDLLNEKIPHVEIGTANYQGGCPDMPKLAKVTVGIANNDHLVMYDSSGAKGIIDFDKVRNVEKFTTKKDPNFKGRSVVLYGPFIPLIFRPKIAHFCVINYIDFNNEENNVLFHSKESGEIDRIYQNVYDSWNRYKKERSKIKSLTNYHIVGATI